jgi:hypothetical protein
VLLKIQSQVQARDAGPDDPDAPSHVRLPKDCSMVVRELASRCWLQPSGELAGEKWNR